MHPIRRYDPAILKCTIRTRTLAQIVRALHRGNDALALQGPMNPHDIELRCEVFARCGVLERVTLPGGELAYRRTRQRPSAPKVPVPHHSTMVGRRLRAGLMATAVLSAYGCAGLGNLSSDPMFPDDLPKYHTERAPNLSRVYQVPGQAVYRLCAGTGCLAPTPKVLARTVPAQAAEAIPVAAVDSAPPRALPGAEPKAVLAKGEGAAPENQNTNAAGEPSGRVAVFFGFASSKLSASALETLKNQAETIKSAKRLVLIGRTDQVGSLERNSMFAKKRADAVKGVLTSLGIKPDLIVVEVDPKTSEALHPNAYSAFKPTERDAVSRRVDLLVF